MIPSEAQLREYHTWNEIASQTRVWEETLRAISQSSSANTVLARSAERQEWLFVGCGTSFYAAEAAASSWMLLTGYRAQALPASEVILFPSLVRAQRGPQQAVVISRSGTTSEAVRAAKWLSQDLGVPTLALTCSPNSALEEACDAAIALPFADEKSTVMTRSFTCMLLALQVLAARRAQNTVFLEELWAAARQFAPRLPTIAATLSQLVHNHSFESYIFLGQGPFYAIAREASLKVAEMSCSNSQFFHTLEFRHGPKAIVGSQTCLTFFLSSTGAEAEAEVLGEMKELGGVTIAVCHRAHEGIREASDMILETGCQGSELSRLAPHVVPGQLLGLLSGLQKGLNPDQPKNLTRIVTLD